MAVLDDWKQMDALEQMKKIAGALRRKYGADAVHQLEIAVLRYSSLGEAGEYCSREPVSLVWDRVQGILDGLDQRQKIYVSNVIDLEDMRRGKLNLVYAPCGSGKTYFVENVLKDMQEKPGKNMLYLAPTVALVRALKFRGDCHLRTDGHGQFIREWRYAGITAMTYAAFGSIVKRERENGTYNDSKLWNDGSVICADELSQAVSQSNYTDRNGRRVPDDQNLTKIALDELGKRISNDSNLVVTVSATPLKLTGRYFHDVRPVGMYLTPKGYRDGEVRNYSDLNKLLGQIDPSKRGLIYIGRVSEMLKAVELLESRGIHAVAIYSRNYETVPMGEEQLAAVEALEMDERIPDDIQVLLINAAYETGLNIRPEKSHLDYVVVHDINRDTQTQARGRYRGDIGTVYHKVEPSSETQIISPDKLEPYIGKRMRTPDKNQLLSEFNFIDDHHRRMRWPTFAKLLEEQGYTIEDGKDKVGRYCRITK